MGILIEPHVIIIQQGYNDMLKKTLVIVALHGYGVAEPADGSVSQEFKDMNEIRFTGRVSPDKHVDPAKLNVEFTKALKILGTKLLDSHVSMRVMTL